MKYRIRHIEQGWAVSTSLPDGRGGSLDATIVHRRLRVIPSNVRTLIQLQRTYKMLLDRGFSPYQAVGIITNSVAKSTMYRAYDPTEHVLDDEQLKGGNDGKVSNGSQ